MEILLFKGDYNIEEVFVLSLRLAIGKINISNKNGKSAILSRKIGS